MKKLLHILIPVFFAAAVANADKPKKCKCDEDAVANRETTNEVWNRLIHEACASVINKDFASAARSLEDALKIGEDKYIQEMYLCSKAMAGTSDAGQVQSAPAKEETMPAPPPPTTEAIREPPSTKPEPLPKPVPDKPTPGPTPPDPGPSIPVAPTASVTKPDVEMKTEPKDEARVFTAEELSAFQSKGMMKVNMFQDYLNKIGNKATSSGEAMDAIKNALKLFYGNTSVQVSSVNRDTKPKFPTKTYLERVRALNYDRIEIEWAECQYTSNLRKAPDGNYYGYIKFRQRFKGIKDGKVVYEDITDKTIAVVLKAYDKAIEGEKVENFDIFLGDIDVVQTAKN